MYKNIILPASLLAGTIIGAGIFALPFVFNQAGTGLGILHLIIFGLALTALHLIYADIIARTKEDHRLAGYARSYLGNWAFGAAIIINVIGLILTLTIYLVLSVSFINLFAAGLASIYKILIFWFLGSLAIFLGINRLALSELLITAGIGAIILIIFIYGFVSPVSSVSIFSFNWGNLFLPYGVVLFALMGSTAIPSVVGYFRKNNLPAIKAKTPIILGTLAPVLIYTLFVFGVLKLSKIVSDDSITGLIGQIPPALLWLLGILGAVSLWSSYIVFGRNVQKSLQYDMRFPPFSAALATIILPLLLYFLGLQNFLELVAIAGGVFISLEGVLTILIWLKARQQDSEIKILKNFPVVLAYLLLLIFAGGIIYTIVY